MKVINYQLFMGQATMGKMYIALAILSILNIFLGLCLYSEKQYFNPFAVTMLLCFIPWLTCMVTIILFKKNK